MLESLFPSDSFRIGKGCILLRAANQGKLSWEDTYKEMARANDDSEWLDWQNLDIDRGDNL